MQHECTVVCTVPLCHWVVGQHDVLTLYSQFVVVFNPDNMRNIHILDDTPQAAITVIPLNEVDLTVQLFDDLCQLISLLWVQECEVTKVIHIIHNTNTAVPAFDQSL